MTQERKETWVDNRWRPAMAWLYFAICLFDFILAPSYFMSQVDATIQWVPLTLSGGGTLHVAMGAIITATAYSRGREKMERMKRLGMGSQMSGEMPGGEHDGFV